MNEAEEAPLYDERTRPGWKPIRDAVAEHAA